MGTCRRLWSVGRRRVWRSGRLVVAFLTVLALATAHVSVAQAVPSEMQPVAATASLPPCHVAMQDPGDKPPLPEQKQPCPLMRGALCVGLFAVFPPVEGASASLRITPAEPWFYESTLASRVISPRERPPKHA